MSEWQRRIGGDSNLPTADRSDYFQDEEVRDNRNTNNVLWIEGINMENEIRKAILSRIDQIVKEEVEKAKLKVQEKCANLAGEISASVVKHIQIREFPTNEMQVVVSFNVK